MKKLKLPAILILGMLISCSLTAQNSVKIGVRAGLGNSYQHWDYTIPQFEWVSGYKDKQRGFELFLTSEIPLNKYLSIRPEIGYMEKGFYSDRLKYDIIAAGGSFDNFTVEARNLSLNTSLKGSVDIYRGINIYLITGLKYDHLLKVNDWIYTENGRLHDDYHDFIFDNYKKVVFSGIFGGGIEWERLFLEFQTNFPLTSSTKNASINVTDYYYGVSIGIHIAKFYSSNEQSTM